MFQRSESPRSQASPILAQNVLRYESPQNINSNNMNIYIMLLEYAQLMMLNSVVRVSRCLPDCLEKWVSESLAFGSGGVLDRFGKGEVKVYTCIGSEVWKERFWFTEKSWMFDEVEGKKLKVMKQSWRFWQSFRMLCC